MRVVIQRVNHAFIDIEGSRHSEIGLGLCVFLGIEKDASKDDIEWLVHKIINLRIFSDPQGKMNLSLKDIKGQLLLVSQFTLHASTKKGNRPSFILAERPERAMEIYKACIALFNKNLSEQVRSGVFGANMKVGLENDGPVTIIIDTELKW